VLWQTRHFEDQRYLLPYFCPSKHFSAAGRNSAWAVGGAHRYHRASRSPFNNSGLKSSIDLLSKVTSYALGLSFYDVPTSVKVAWKSLPANTTFVKEMCCYRTRGRAFQHVISAESKCTSLPTAAVARLSPFRQRYIMATYFSGGKKKK